MSTASPITESQLQDFCGRLVSRHVLACVSSTISALAKSTEAQEALEVDADEILNICQQPYVSIDRSSAVIWEQNDRWHCLVLEERYTPDDWESVKSDFDAGTLEGDNVHSSDLSAGVGFDEAAAFFRSQAWFPKHCKPGDVYGSPDDAPAEEAWDEAYEHWIISNDLAYWFNKLPEPEMVGEPLPDRVKIWGRCTSGQAISMDGCIRDVVMALLAANPSYFD